MTYISTVIKQFTDLLPRDRFFHFVEQFGGDKYAKGTTCWMQINALLSSQANGWDSLREIELGLRLHQKKMYHVGGKAISRSTLAYANEHRNYQIYEGLFYDLVPLCRGKIGAKKKFRFKNDLYALDSTTIDLCLSLFPWATFRQTKGAIKLHQMFDIKSQIPEFLVMTTGKRNDIAVARELDFSGYLDSIIVFDRGYEDFKWWYKLDKQGVNFVTRLQDNVCYQIIGQHTKSNRDGVIRDEIIKLTGIGAETKYPTKLRLVTYYDAIHGKLYKFITNILHLSAKTIADIYKARWEIEIFFKWLKQNLKIKTFLGTSKNAVLTQIWVAMIYYLLLTYIKYQTKYSGSLTMLTLVIGEMFFDRIPLIDLLSPQFISLSRGSPTSSNQLALFD